VGKTTNEPIFYVELRFKIVLVFKVDKLAFVVGTRTGIGQLPSTVLPSQIKQNSLQRSIRTIIELLLPLLRRNQQFLIHVTSSVGHQLWVDTLPKENIQSKILS
jgi:hypothetical protein